MVDRPQPRRRADLDPLHRAVSDTLDEVGVRLHGNLISSWAYPEEFLEWLAESGYSVVSTAELETARAALVTPDAAVYNLVWTAARNEVTRSWLASKGLVVMTGEAHAGELADLRRLRGEADLRAEKAEAALAEATAELAHLAGVGNLADREIDLSRRRLALLQDEARLRDAAIARVRALHRVHSCEVDGHKLDRTPNPCVNDGACSCGRRDPCPTLAALDPPEFELIELTHEEWETARDNDLAKLGCTLAKLEEMARTGDYATPNHRALWLAIKPVPPETPR